MRLISVLAFLILPFSAVAQEPGVKIIFTPESEKFVAATKEYQEIWNREGKRIIDAMEEVSGLKFADKEIRPIVFEGVSFSGIRDIPMKMRASYPHDVKKATLIHELGHRLIAPVKKTEEIDEHRALFLILYDIWVNLYGKDFADESVVVESRRKGVYDYETAWKWALALSADERASKLKQLVEMSEK